MTRTFLLLILTVTFPALAQQTQKAQQEKMPVIQLTIRPAAEPRPALKYQFLPPVLDETPGNAALLYHTAIEIVSNADQKEKNKKIKDWVDLPLNKLPSSKEVDELTAYKAAMPYIELASQRERCDWERPMSEGFNLDLPDLSSMRSIARYVALQTRMQISKEHLGTAIHTLQTGFSISRHIADGSTVICDLVGIAIGDMMLKQVEQLIQAPGAPNFYWALTSLPCPFVNIHRSIQQESFVLYRTYPFLLDLETKPPTLQQYHTLNDVLVRIVTVTTETSQKKLTDMAIKDDYPNAKRYLIEQGKSSQQVEAMPALQAVLIYYVRTYENARDDIFKWFNVPYWQGRDGVGQEEQQIDKLIKQVPNNKFLVLARSFGRFYFIATNLDRHIAALRCIEAVRLFAAAHNNKLPNSLNDITEVPIPNDPMSGKQFVYTVSGSKAILESSPPPGHPAHDGIKYEITLVQ
ncbi:MAG: hypothetical protein WC975_06140 [Phycisphaerae bacterium]